MATLVFHAGRQEKDSIIRLVRPIPALHTVCLCRATGLCLRLPKWGKLAVREVGGQSSHRLGVSARNARGQTNAAEHRSDCAWMFAYEGLRVLCFQKAIQKLSAMLPAVHAVKETSAVRLAPLMVGGLTQNVQDVLALDNAMRQQLRQDAQRKSPGVGFAGANPRAAAQGGGLFSRAQQAPEQQQRRTFSRAQDSEPQHGHASGAQIICLLANPRPSPSSCPCLISP